MARLRPLRTPVLLIALVTGLSAITSAGSPSIGSAAQIGLVYLVAVVGTSIFVSNSGVLSFGQVSFMAIGAYVYSLLTIPSLVKQGLLPHTLGVFAHSELSLLPAALIAAGVAALFALLVAVPLMRLSGLGAGIATLAVLVIVNVVISNAEEITGGHNTLVGVPTSEGPMSTLPWAIVAILIAFAYGASRFGARLRTSREDEHASRAIGVSIARERTVAFVLSAFVMGLAGAAYANALGSISADAFYLDLTFLTLTMLIVGGMSSLTGAVVGAIVVTVISELLRHIENGMTVLGAHVSGRTGMREVGLGILLLLILILRPGGIVGSGVPNWLGELRRAFDERRSGTRELSS